MADKGAIIKGWFERRALQALARLTFNSAGSLNVAGTVAATQGGYWFMQQRSISSSPSAAPELMAVTHADFQSGLRLRFVKT